jgi:hypothetical protein
MPVHPHGVGYLVTGSFGAARYLLCGEVIQR